MVTREIDLCTFDELTQRGKSVANRCWSCAFDWIYKYEFLTRILVKYLRMRKVQYYDLDFIPVKEHGEIHLIVCGEFERDGIKFVVENVCGNVLIRIVEDNHVENALEVACEWYTQIKCFVDTAYREYTMLDIYDELDVVFTHVGSPVPGKFGVPQDTVVRVYTHINTAT